jgi:diphosphomevalonate decarboxylase
MHATARAQPNIALVKYWGKRDLARNLPAVGSVSITLEDLYTEMRVSFDAPAQGDVLVINGREDTLLLPRLSRCLDSVAGKERAPALIESRSNFPIGAGLASSASAFAAATVAASAAAGLERDRHTLAELAGAASGSAARSLFDGFVELETGADGISVSSLRPPEDWPLSVVIAVTEPGPKAIGSGDAMELSRRTSPFYRRWVAEQPQDMQRARTAVREDDFATLAEVAEHNCLKMHSLMWTSRPAVVYWNAVTLACMQTVTALRADGVPVFFTIDAGPQVKAVCEPQAAGTVREALAAVAGVRDLLTTGLGRGARLVAEA